MGLTDMINNIPKTLITDDTAVYNSKDVLNSLTTVLPKLYEASLTLAEEPITKDTDWDTLLANHVYTVNSFKGTNAPLKLSANTGLVVLAQQGKLTLTIALSSTGIAFKTGNAWEYLTGGSGESNGNSNQGGGITELPNTLAYTDKLTDFTAGLKSEGYDVVTDIRFGKLLHDTFPSLAEGILPSNLAYLNKKANFTTELLSKGSQVLTEASLPVQLAANNVVTVDNFKDQMTANDIMQRADFDGLIDKNTHVLHRDPDTFKIKEKSNFSHGDLQVNSTPIPSFWFGTQKEYDAINPKDANTLYLIKEG